MRKCKSCRKELVGKRSHAKFCSDNCRKRYWEFNIEPRGICEDCGTQLGQKSLRNIKRGKQKAYCRSCSQYRRRGTGRDI